MTICDKAKKVSLKTAYSGWKSAINKKGQKRKRPSGGGQILCMLNFQWLKESRWQGRNATQESHCPHCKNKTSYSLDVRTNNVLGFLVFTYNNVRCTLLSSDPLIYTPFVPTFVLMYTALFGCFYYQLKQSPTFEVERYFRN